MSYLNYAFRFPKIMVFFKQFVEFWLKNLVYMTFVKNYLTWPSMLSDFIKIPCVLERDVYSLIVWVQVRASLFVNCIVETFLQPD